MLPKIISETFHAYIDYPVAIGLIAFPFILGLGDSNPFAVQLSVATGIAAFILTVLTDHKTGIIKILSYKIHLTVDGLVGVAFVAAPFIFGFSGLDAIYYWGISSDT